MEYDLARKQKMISFEAPWEQGNDHTQSSYWRWDAHRQPAPVQLLVLGRPPPAPPSPAIGAGTPTASLPQSSCWRRDAHRQPPSLGRLTSVHQHPEHSTLAGLGVPLGLGVKNMGESLISYKPLGVCSSFFQSDSTLRHGTFSKVPVAQVTTGRCEEVLPPCGHFS